MKLKHTKEVKIIVDYNDFNELVEQTYGKDYNFVVDVECGNDSQHTYSAKKGELKDGDYDKDELNKFIETGEHSYLVETLLNDLADKGIIEEGNYLIEVCW